MLASPSYLRLVGLTSLLLLSAVVCWGASAEFQTGLAQLDRGETAAAMQISERLQRTQERDRQREGAYLFVRRMCLAGKTTEATAMLAALGGTREVDPDLELCRIGILAGCGRSADAIAAADALADAGGLPGVRALALLSELRCHQAAWDEARRAVEFAQRLLASVDSSGVENALRDQLARQRTRVEDGAATATHGLGYILWRTAQRQRRDGDPAAARATAEHLLTLAVRNRGTPWFAITGPDDPRLEQQPIPMGYALAAELLVGDCLLREGRLEAAEAALSAIVARDDHPYAGEAMRLLGDLYLEGRADLRRAELAYSRALLWIDEVVAGTRRPSVGDVPEISTLVVTPPPEMRRKSDWGKLLWNDPEPGQLFEPARCGWYLAAQRQTSTVRRALCRWQLGRVEEAVADLAIITATDPIDAAVTRSGMPSNYLRLRDGFRANRLYITQRELAAFRQPVRRMALLLAELEFEQEHWSAAVDGYRRFLALYDRAATQPELVYVRYALACARDANGETKAATADLKELRKVCHNTPTWARVLIALSQDYGAPQRALLAEVAADRSAPDELRAKAMYRLGQLSMLAGNKDDARRRMLAVVAMGERAGPSAFVAKAVLDVLDIVQITSPISSEDPPQ